VNLHSCQKTGTFIRQDCIRELSKWQFTNINSYAKEINMTAKPMARFLDKLSSHKTFVFITGLVIAGLYLFIEHTAHVFNLLPYGLLLLCPLMHLFMHRNHGGHGQTAEPGHDAHRQHALPPQREDRR
jgi:hypothetical protein